MNKEPIGLYIFRYVLGLGLFAFMCMLYWSSTIVEDDLRVLRNDIAQLKNDIFTLHIDMEKMHGDILETLLNEKSHLATEESNVRSIAKPISNISTQKRSSQNTVNSPNLL